jgi:hypothetical protein
MTGYEPISPPEPYCEPHANRKAHTQPAPNFFKHTHTPRQSLRMSIQVPCTVPDCVFLKISLALSLTRLYATDNISFFDNLGAAFSRNSGSHVT